MADAQPAPVPAEGDRRLGYALLGLALVWAAVVGSNFLQVSSWIAGDIAYHRGVSYTMQGAAWQGEGPFVGLLTYYGGLYPLVLGWFTEALGVPFDTVLSVASWGIALLWPAAAWWLSGRVWPGRPVARGLFVVLATTAAPFTNRVLIWVDSPLASAQNAFPAYPRDLALILLLVAMGSSLAGSRRSRVLGTGLAIGGIVVFHLQIAMVTGWLVVALALVMAARDRSLAPLKEVAAAGALALVVSAWWWIPRVDATITSGGLLLGGFPGSPPLRLGLDNIFMAFGVVAVLAAFGLAVVAARRPLPGRLLPFAIWLIALLPLVVADRLVDGSDLLSERRAWLLASIPLTVVAASTAALVVGRLRRQAAIAFIALVVIAPSIPGTLATVRLVRDAWDPGRIGGRVFDTTRWDPLLADLVTRVRAEGHHVVDTYDGYAAWVWSLSGAQVPSLWLPGPFKLGFDPEVMTGTGYLDRLRAQEAAFDGGRAAICAHASSNAAGSIVLDVQGGLVGTLDETPASPYRVDPVERSSATIERRVAPGIFYVDKGSLDVLRLEAGRHWQPRFRSSTAGLLALEFTTPVPRLTLPGGSPLGPLVEITTGSGTVTAGAGLATGPARVVVPVDGVDDRVVITALEPVDLVRITAFEQLGDLTLPPGDGVVRWPTGAFCPAP